MRERKRERECRERERERERERLYFKVFEFYLEYSTELKFHAFQKQHFEEMQ